jgi:hypothetical protein
MDCDSIIRGFEPRRSPIIKNMKIFSYLNTNKLKKFKIFFVKFSKKYFEIEIFNETVIVLIVKKFLKN